MAETYTEEELDSVFAQEGQELGSVGVAKSEPQRAYTDAELDQQFGVEGSPAPAGPQGLEPDEVEPPPVPWRTRVEGGIVGMMQGLTGDFTDEMIGQVKSLVDSGLSSEEATQQVRDKFEAIKNESPATYYPSYITGSVISPIAKLTKPIAGGGMFSNAAKAGLAGGVYGAGASEAENATGVLWDSLKSVAAAGAVDTAFRAAPAAYRTFVAGVKPSNHRYYIDNMKAVENVDEMKLLDDVSSATSTLESQAKKAKTNYKTANQEFYDASSNIKLEMKDVGVPEELIESMPNALRELGKLNSQSSSDAFDVLSSSGVTFETAPFVEQLKQAQRNMKGLGDKVPPGLGDDYNMLSSWINYIKKEPEISAEDTKRLVMAIDNVSNNIYAKLAGGSRPSVGEREILNLRRSIHEELLSVEGYDEVMKPLRDSTKLSYALEGLFNDPRKTRLTLEGIAKGGRPEDAKSLAQLTELLGKDFLGPLEPMMTAKGMLNNPVALRQQYNRLPEKVAADEAEALADQAMTLSKRMAPFSEQRVQQTLRTLRQKENPEFRREMSSRLIELGKIAEQDFAKPLKDLSIREALDRPFVKGSRNVNMMSYSFSGAATALAKFAGVGDPQATASVMKGVGALIGGASDIIGPKFYRLATRARFNEKLRPYFDTLEMSLTRGVENVLLTDYLLKKNSKLYRDAVNNPIGKEEDEAYVTDPELIKAKIAEIEASETISPLDKAKQLNRINKDNYYKADKPRVLMQVEDRVEHQEKKKLEDFQRDFGDL